jgi:glucose-1-phosphate thymidylyltransferase
MKTIVLAAGYATRLYPLTENFPKPLLEIGRSTILDRMLDDLDTIPDITGHIVVTNGKFAPIFEEWAADRLAGEGADIRSLRFAHPSHCAPSELVGPSRSCGHGRPQAPESAPSPAKPVRIVNDGTFTNETRLGAVCDLLLAIESLGIDDDLLVMAADNILEFSFRGFVEYAKEKGTSCIMCHEQPSIEKLQRTGVIEVDGDMRVLSMEEKPQVPRSHWAVPPFYIYLKKDLDLVRHAVENGCGKDAPGNLAHYMVEHTAIHAWPMPGARFDIGSLDTYEEAKLKYSI